MPQLPEKCQLARQNPRSELTSESSLTPADTCSPARASRHPLQQNRMTPRRTQQFNFTLHAGKMSGWDDTTFLGSYLHLEECAQYGATEADILQKDDAVPMVTDDAVPMVRLEEQA